MVYHEQKEQDWREQAAALQKRLDYYEQENARLQLQNEALQEASVFRRLSVEDNIRAVLEMTKMTKEEQKELEKIQKEKNKKQY